MTKVNPKITWKNGIFKNIIFAGIGRFRTFNKKNFFYKKRFFTKCSNVWFKFTVVHTPLGDPRGFTSTLIDTGNFHLKIQCEISRRSGFHQKKRKKVKSPEGGMYDGKFEPHINKKNFTKCSKSSNSCKNDVFENSIFTGNFGILT